MNKKINNSSATIEELGEKVISGVKNSNTKRAKTQNVVKCITRFIHIN